MTSFEDWFEGYAPKAPEYLDDCARDAWKAGQAAERERMRSLIEAAEAVIEAAKRHGSVGYADRQMVYLNAVVERINEGDQ